MQERFVSGSHFGAETRGLTQVNKFVANPNLRPETAKIKKLPQIYILIACLNKAINSKLKRLISVMM